MTIQEFAWAVYQYCKRFDGYVTSWGRTDAHAKAVGGFAGDPHTWWRGADVGYDTGPNRVGSDGHPRLPRSCPQCAAFGLKVIHETGHDHLQPMDFPAGPVTSYNGEIR